MGGEFTAGKNRPQHQQQQQRREFGRQQYQAFHRRGLPRQSRGHLAFPDSAQAVPGQQCYHQYDGDGHELRQHLRVGQTLEKLH